MFGKNGERMSTGDDTGKSPEKNKKLVLNSITFQVAQKTVTPQSCGIYSKLGFSANLDFGKS